MTLRRITAEEEAFEGRPLIDLFLERSTSTPVRAAYTFLEEDGAARTWTFGELGEKVRGIGRRLEEQGLRGERALLLYPPGLEFIAAFLACLASGVVAVPAYPPGSRRTLPRVRAIARDAQPAVALTTRVHLEKFEKLSSKAPELAPVRWLATDDVAVESDVLWTPRPPGSDDLAFLQYTSGSTSTPKGVMISHGNLAHNEEMIHRAFGTTEESVIVGWLPLYHDMGLIGNVLQPLYLGARCILMAPVTFLRQPRRWLEAITTYRGTTSGAPNFAYELCVRRIPKEERQGLDLSSWSLAFSGAEPVRGETLKRFATSFAPQGFRPQAFYPCYGLAEGTLLVTGGSSRTAPRVDCFLAEGLEAGRGEKVEEGLEEVPAKGRLLVSCGRTWGGQRMEIVDPESRQPCPAGQVGEIWVSGPSIAQGYWQQEDLTRQDFGARLANEGGANERGANERDANEAFLRTGDLGFFEDGELFVTGRIKDLIILRGRNHYPQDLELTVDACHPELRPGCGAAFSVEVEGEERLVVVQEQVRRPSQTDFEAIAGTVREALAREHEVRLEELVVVRWGSIPKTSSGKIQRRACREAYLAGELAVVGRGGAGAPASAPQSLGSDLDSEILDGTALRDLPESERPEALARILRAKVAEVLRVAPGGIPGDVPLTALGIDSLAAVELQQAVQDSVGLELSLGRLLEGARIFDLVREIEDRWQDIAPSSSQGPRARGPSKPGEFPLSRGQEALWFLQQVSPDETATQIAAAVDIHGNLDASALRRAVKELSQRHSELRTTFRSRAGEPVKVLHGELEPEITFEAAESLSQLEVEEFLEREAHRPFDLVRGPLLRLHLLRRGETQHILLLVIHHLVTDFWSLSVWFEELRQLYETPGSPLPDLPLAYDDTVRWREELLAGSVGTESWDFWAETLQGPLPDLELPTDRPRPPVQSSAGDDRRLHLDRQTSEALGELAQGSGSTLFTLLAAGLLALLHRHSGQDRLLLGTPTAGRTDSALAPVVGYFVNPVVILGEASGNPSFEGYLEQIRGRVAGALEHQDLPFPMLAERLRPLRDPSRSPLFQVMLTLQRSHRREVAPLAAFALGEPGARLDLGPLRLECRALPHPSVQFDLSFTVAPVGDGLGLRLDFNRDLFDGATAQRLLDRWSVLLASAAENPRQPLGELSLLREGERRQFLVDFNSTARPLPEATIHGLFAERAALEPEAIALVFGGEEISYGALLRRSQRLARFLVAQGVGQESPVAILLERSPALVTALLGTLLAGGSYVPLDPTYPRDRIAFVLEDCGAAVLLCDGELARDRSALPEVVVALDSQGWVEGQPTNGWEEGRLPPVPAAQRAYVIYTSGSTGRPKGVEVDHPSVVNFLQSMARRPGLLAEDILVAVTTVSFDIAGLELFLPLTRGAQVVLADRATAADGAALRELLEASRATVLQATPATWRLLLAAGWNGEPRLEALCGGEALPQDLAQEIRSRARSLWNVYGPTETTIWSTVHRLPLALGAESGSVSLGRPIDNTSVYILGPGAHPQPPPISGELVIGGEGLARGYLHRPALTAERFIPDGFGGGEGQRLYRTGDLARWSPEGRLQYLGRLDHQIKIRGHRIELGEVEACLESFEDVRQAVVVAREVTTGDSRLVAYVVQDGGIELAPEELRSALRERLPEVFVPSFFVSLEAMPLTPNGKVDRSALPDPPQLRRDLTGSSAAPASALEDLLAKLWAQVLGVEGIGRDDNFFDLGGHSLLVAKVHAQLLEELETDLTIVELFRFPTIRTLAQRLSGSGEIEVPAARPENSLDGRAPHRESRDIAIIGMAGRFPGAPDVETLWRRLRGGEECITTFSEEELLEAGVEASRLADPDYVRASGYLADADLFDARFFDIPEREAELMDPQHRLFLECAWASLEDAGYDPGRYDGRVAVFGSVGIQTYAHEAGLGEVSSEAARYQAFVGNDKDFVPTRVAYKLNLRGPAINVQTACSSSLVGVHLAVRSLLAGEAEMALVGGCTVRTPLKAGYLYEEGGIPSPDGHCRPFDKDAAGTVFANGAGMVVLKPLHRALEDGDRIRAVVKGSAVNNDGDGKIGFTAPSVDGQAAAIREALRQAGIDGSSVSYVETHGTGTPLGDPIEVAALEEAFRGPKASGPEGSEPEAACALGSVKSNLGHLDTAAGVTGLIKTVLALEHEEMPPTVHFQEANPKLALEASRFFVPGALQPWPRGSRPRRAGVSSFGIGGTNAHVVLEEAPLPSSSESSRPWQLLLISGRSEAAKERVTEGLAKALPASEINLADVAFTLSVGRRPFEHRSFLVAENIEDAAAVLLGEEEGTAGRMLSAVAGKDAPSIAFLFPGQGAQYPHMARDLYEAEPVFRTEVDRCCDLLEPLLVGDLRSLLFPSEAPEESSPEESPADRLARTAFTQPALFVVEYALARLWMSWGIVPGAMLGHSVGEYVAACLAGVFELPAALALVTARGRLMQSLPAGAMLSVELSESEILPWLGEEISLAAINGPRHCVVSGASEAVAALEERLKGQGVACRPLRTSHAFHSAMMDPILETFRAEVERARPQAPTVPFLSNTTGDWIRPEQAVDPAYWSAHLRGGVRFADGLGKLREDPRRFLLEVGPGNTLSVLARKGGATRVTSSLRHPREKTSDVAHLLGALGRLWLAGAEVDWTGFWSGEERQRRSLPTYPFERKRYWVEARPDRGRISESRRRAPQDGLEIPLWRQAPPRPPASLAEQEPWLLFADAGGVVRNLLEELKRRPSRPPVTVVVEGESFQALGTEQEADYALRPDSQEDYDSLISALEEAHRLPRCIVHGWGLSGEDRRPDSGELLTGLEASRRRGFDSLIALARALERAGTSEPTRWTVLVDGLLALPGETPRRPDKALVLGPLKVIPQEFPVHRLRCVDLEAQEALGPAAAALLGPLLEEVASPVEPEDRLVAFRRSVRWLQGYGELRLPEAPSARRLRERGVYLITGGLGDLGLAVAEDLAREVRARLVLVGRRPMPPRDEWPRIAREGTAEDRRGVILRRLLALEETGAEVLTVAADVADEAELSRAILRGEARFGPLHGVIHAAGVAGGGMLQGRTPAQVQAVLTPKVQGTLVLSKVLGDRPLDFFVLFSSITGTAGGFGQADYCAANAFLDSFATSHLAPPDTYTVAIAWDRWEEVGMAARSSQAADFWQGGDAGASTGHPLLGAAITETAQQAIYAATLSAQDHWILGEHRIAGLETLPGTAYLEMARAAFEERFPGPVTLSEIVFLAPLSVGPGESRQVLTMLEAEGEGRAFRVVSRPVGGDPGAWTEHARGRVGPATAKPPSKVDLEALGARCNERELTALSHHRGSHGSFLVTGPRWQSLRLMHAADRESLALLELPDELHGDLESYALHPALLDVAAGAVQFLAQGNFLPLAYEKLTLWRPMPARSFSHFRLRGDLEPSAETLTCDISLLDEEGETFAAIEGFSMKRVGEEVAAALASGATSSPSVPIFGLPGLSSPGAALPAPAVPGIRPEEGTAVLRRLVDSAVVPRVLVTTLPVATILAQTDALDRDRLGAGLTGEPTTLHERPAVSSDFVAPADDVERRIAGVWQRVLGLERVGVHDNFFELGGSSLNGVQLVAELKKELGVEIPTVAIFEAPTVSSLTRYLKPKDEKEEAFSDTRRRAERKRQALKSNPRAARRRRP